MKKISVPLAVCMVLAALNITMRVFLRLGLYDTPELGKNYKRYEFSVDESEISDNDIRLTEYMYTDYVLLENGYTYVEREIGDNNIGCILKPDGTELFDPHEYRTGIYGLPPEGYYNHMGLLDGIVTSYPQGSAGNYFYVADNNGNEGIINSEGEFIVPCEYNLVSSTFSDYCIFRKVDQPWHSYSELEWGLLYGPTGKILISGKLKEGNPGEGEFILNDTVVKGRGLLGIIKNGKIYFYNGDQLYEQRDITAEDENRYMYDSKGNSFVTFQWALPEFQFGLAEMHYENYTDEENRRLIVDSDRVDNTYFFNRARINGKTYYALFKHLDEGQTKEEFLKEAREKTKYTLPELPTPQEIYERNTQLYEVIK